MKAVVVYESLWGNTAAIARAIAEGIGPEARALSTAEAAGEALVGVDLIVAGAPVLGFKLPTDQMRRGALANPGGKPPRPADLSDPSMRSWLDALPAGQGRSAAFDTQVRGPFGKAAPTIAEALEKAGYSRLADPVGFTVAGKFGPLRKGEVSSARGAGVASWLQPRCERSVRGAGAAREAGSNADSPRDTQRLRRFVPGYGHEILPATAGRFAAILDLNEQFVDVLAPLSRERLELLDSPASFYRVAIDEDIVVEFVLAFGSDTQHDSVNFRWFAARYSRFLYVDRVVVSSLCQGGGVGRLLYQDVFAFARRQDYEQVTCEIDADPPNPRSERFHAAFGFREVGSQQVQYAGGGPKRVFFGPRRWRGWPFHLDRASPPRSRRQVRRLGVAASFRRRVAAAPARRRGVRPAAQAASTPRPAQGPMGSARRLVVAWTASPAVIGPICCRRRCQCGSRPPGAKIGKR